MKKFLAGFIVFTLVFAVAPSFVSAQDDGTTRDTTISNNSTDKEEARATRIEDIKTRVTERLSDSEATRVAGICNASQEIVTRLQINVDKAKEARQTKYTAISEKLGALVARLQSTTADTTALDSAIVEFNSQVAGLITDITEYQTVLTDLAEMDCGVDPSGFKAVLSEARSQRAELVSQSQAIRAYVTEDIKAALSAIKGQLTADTSASEEG